jgi:heptaprenyl diphosphate synthase
VLNIYNSINLPILKKELDRLELKLKESVSGYDTFLDEVALHLINAGGKRIRPCLTILSSLADFEGTIDESMEVVSADVITGAVAIELVHLASLYHDDVMDEATQRRNVESVNSKWGNLVAIVTGDYLLAKSASIAASLGSVVASLLANALSELCAGQISEVNKAFNPNRTLEEYFNSIGGKTASLMSTACHIGAIIGNVSDSTIKELVDIGTYLGYIFQIRDDILDVAANFDKLGKSPGQDLAEGIYNLPAILAMNDPIYGSAVTKKLGKVLNDQDMTEVSDLIKSTDSIKESLKYIESYLEILISSTKNIKSEQVKESFVNLGIQLAEDAREVLTEI